MLRNKNAIITGARRGIGLAMVETFAKNGANIWACARTIDVEYESQLQSLSQKYGVEIWPIYFDITQETEIKSAVQQIKKQGLTIDILVNVAGVAEESGSFTMSSLEKMRKVFEVNFWGQTVLTQYVFRLMMRNKTGNILFISSVAGADGAPAQYEYVASKAAINGGTRELARELWPYGIRVNAIAPGIIETDMGKQISDELRKETLQKVIMNREGRPEEIANVAAFLTSDLASYMTGQIIRVDGGM